MQILISILFYSLAAWFVISTMKKMQREINGVVFWSSYGLKMLFGVGYLLLYTYYYGDGQLSEDGGTNYREALLLKDLFFEHPGNYFRLLFGFFGSDEIMLEVFRDYPYSIFCNTAKYINESRNFIKLLSVLFIFSSGYLLPVFYLLLHFSFVTILKLFVTTRNRSTKLKDPYFLLFFLPSFALWSSSLLKEVIGIIGICFVILYFIEPNSKVKWKHLILGIVLLILFKPFWLLFLFVGAVAHQTFLLLILKSWAFRIGILMVIIAIFLSPLFQFATNKISDKQYDFINIAKGGYHFNAEDHYICVKLKDSSSIKQVNQLFYTFTEPISSEYIPFGKHLQRYQIEIPPYRDTLELELKIPGAASKFNLTEIKRSRLSLIKMAPEAILNTMVRPFPNENQSNFLLLFFGLENLIFLFIIILSLIISIRKKSLREELWLMISFSLTFALMIGYITPISGAIIRYRIPIHLFQICSLLFILPSILNKWKTKSH
jgi:hypothetical protein